MRRKLKLRRLRQSTGASLSLRVFGTSDSSSKKIEARVLIADAERHAPRVNNGLTAAADFPLSLSRDFKAFLS
jgi:hypothetical protein